jgi:hypothetical protein
MPAGRLVVRGGKLVTVDEAALAAAVEAIAPAFRRDAQALAARHGDLTALLLRANREAWDVPLGSGWLAALTLIQCPDRRLASGGTPTWECFTNCAPVLSA